MFASSFTVATAEEVVTRMADVGTTAVKQWGGRVLIGVGLWLVVLAFGATFFARFFPVHPEAQGQMPGMGASGNPTPPVKGFAKGQEVRFIHTEASDPQVAEMLTRMMGPKVLLVPSLREIPDRLLATVFVFRNGIKGEGPMGFQPDVFDTVPGELQYTPLRRVVFVTWKEERRARVLRSAVEIWQATEQGAVQLTTPGIVVNMPILTWPGGQR
ncbi:MAG: DUF7482 domain-containing protein [Acidimicrobiia bacterium]